MNMMYDAETESYLLRILLEKFLKETIELDSGHSITATARSHSSSYLSDSGYDSDFYDSVVSLHALTNTMWDLQVFKRAALMRTSNVDQKINDLFFKLDAKYQIIDGLLELNIFYRAIQRGDDLHRSRTLHSEEKFIEFLRVAR